MQMREERKAGLQGRKKGGNCKEGWMVKEIRKDGTRSDGNQDIEREVKEGR